MLKMARQSPLLPTLCRFDVLFKNAVYFGRNMTQPF